MPVRPASHFSAHMRVSKEMIPTPTDLIDWMNDEGLLDLEWDFPEDGDLYEAGLEPAVVVDLVAALEEKYGIEMTPEEFKKQKINTPAKMAKMIASKMG